MTTPEMLDAKLRYFIGIVLGLTLMFTVLAVLYSLVFVTQPMKGSAPNDEKFFALIGPIATFLTGALAGIMIAPGRKQKDEPDAE
jgi:hypothetical protein